MNNIYDRKRIKNYNNVLLHLTCLLAFFCLGISSGYATIRYVTPTGNGNGSSWANASSDIAAMISASANGDQIWIKKGTYTPSASLSMKNGVAIYGGFAGTETALNQRNFTTNIVILNGNNTRRVFNNSSLNNTAVLDGVTISNGAATNFGGGMLNTSSNPTISNCTFQNNRANNSAGGGMYNSSSSPTIANCVFTGNNTVSSTGGGGIYNAGTSNPIINNCVFDNNNANGNPGGAIFNESSSATTINNSVFTGNSGGNGGAIYDGTNNSSKFANCVFTNNSGSLGGAFYFSSSSTSSIIFCTITNNSGYQGGGILTSSTNIKITNSIVFNNAASNGGPNIFFTSTPPTVIITNSDIQGGYAGPGTGNINADPIFFSTANRTGNDGVWMTADDGLQLKPGSPCLYTGTTGVGIPTTDILGVTRSATAPTIGAYEAAISSKIFVNAGITTSGNGFTWATAKKTIQEALQLAYADTIWVATGTYIPAATLNMRNGLAIIGGFSGIETQLSQRNFANNPTIISGANTRQVFNNANLNNTAVLDGCIISNGNSTTNGAGMYNYYASPVIRNCVFKDNTCNSTVNDGGGGMFNYYSDPAITNCVFANNTVNNDLSGGGMSNDNSNPIIYNCLFTGNIVNGYGLGGGIFNFFSNPVINNAVLTGNLVPDNEGGGIYNWSSNPVITNTIIYGNSATTSSNIVNLSSSPVITYSDIEGGYAGTGNINWDPLFLNGSLPAGTDGKWMTADDGLQLRILSPALNIGNNAVVPGNSIDITGAPRIQAAIVDMGAYEFQSCTNTRVIYVDSTYGSDTYNGSSWAMAFKTLAVALAYSQFCDVTDSILVAKGTYYPTGAQNGSNRDGAFLIFRGRMKIYGGYPSGGGIRNITAYPTILSGNIGAVNNSADNSNHVMVVAGLSALADSVVVDGLTISGGNSSGASPSPMLINGVSVDRLSGGGVFLVGNNNNANIVFKNCNFSLNSTQAGGGLFINSTSPSIINCAFNNNSSGYGGGIYNDNISTPPVITNCSFNNNLAGTAGGGMYNINSSPTLTNCSFANNTGGGMYNRGSSPILNNTSFSNNIGYSFGGGMYNAGSNPILTNCYFNNNSATSFGGGMYCTQFSSPNITNCSFSNNSATKGGGLYNEQSSSPIISQSFWSSNTASGDGGGIFTSGGSPNIAKSTFNNNTAVNGGAMYNINSSPIASNCTFLANTASQEGGSIYNNGGSLSLSNTTLKSNLATGTGGGMNNYSCNVTIQNCTINSNTSNSNGGGIFNNISNVTIQNCAITSNTSHTDGGGIFSVSTPLSIINATISNNTASQNGGGAYLYNAGPVTIKNSIIYGNNGNVYVPYGNFLTITNSNIGGGYAGTGNINANPLFVDAANGNYYLSCGSPCLNMGANSSIPPGVLTDLEGATRIQAGTVDIGAYEGAWPGTNNLATGNVTYYKELQSGKVSYGTCGSLITTLSSTGTNPLSDSVGAKVWIETSQSSEFVKRHYEITPKTNASTATCSVTLYFTQQEFNDFNAVNTVKLPATPSDASGKINLLIEKRGGVSSDGSGLPSTYTGAITTINPPDSTIVWNIANSRWEVSFDVTGFSGFWVKTQSVVLPVTLVSFSGSRNGNANILKWQTANEINLSKYEVESSKDGSVFSVIAEVVAINNSNYSYTDKVPNWNQNNLIYYRLKMIDIDGSIKYSTIIKLKKSETTNLEIYPNPVKDVLTINGLMTGDAIKLFDVSGKLVVQKITNTQSLQLNVSDLSSGVYFLSLQRNNSTIEIKKVFKE